VADIHAHEDIRDFERRQVFVGEAPGRVNLIGEHTDYSGGYVLPTVIPQTTSVAVAANPDAHVRVFSRTVPVEAGRATFTIGEEARQHGWVDYVQGVTSVLQSEGVALGGFDAIIDSTVPLGSGLSSSASLIVALLRALRTLYQLALDDLVLAGLARRVETDFLGIPVGPMDPLACTLGRPGYAVLLDTRSLASELVQFPAGLDVAVVNSGIRHSHATGGYRERQQQCVEAAARLGVAMLRVVSETHLAVVEALSDPLNRRARHVVTENARVLAAVEAMRQGDLVQLGRLVDASHESLRDDFEVSTPEVDALVAIARRQQGVFGARITGGGFGGAIVIVTRGGAARQVADDVTRLARAELSLDATALVPA
jgi:galactokinase